MQNLKTWFWFFILVLTDCGMAAAERPATIERVKASVVGVGTYLRTRVPPVELRATGFVVADGRHVLTNAHAVPDAGGMKDFEQLRVIVGRAGRPGLRSAELVARDQEHDLALLRIAGPPMQPLELRAEPPVREGEEYLFTGFPIGMVLGFYPVTHRAMVASLVPIAMPAGQGAELSAERVRRLRRKPFTVIQLDGTAYPGNSGSPLYDPRDGRVVGILNSVLVKRTRENLLKDPSGISYAIPVLHALPLLRQAGVNERR